MTISDIIKNSGYAAVFGFMGLIIGIWTADLLYRLILHNMEHTTIRVEGQLTFPSSIALIIIVLIIAAASVFGFTKGKKLLED